MTKRERTCRTCLWLMRDDKGRLYCGVDEEEASQREVTATADTPNECVCYGYAAPIVRRKRGGKGVSA